MKTAILILAAGILLLNCSSDEPGSQEVILQKIYDNSGGKGDSSAIIMEDLKAIGLKNLEDARLKQYQRAIAAKTDFSNPATVGEVQEIIDSSNNIIQKTLGKWSLIRATAGFSPPTTYNLKDIVWDFKEDKVIVMISINLDGIDRDYFGYLINGEYTYSLSSHGVSSYGVIIYLDGSDSGSIYLDDSGEAISLSHYFREDNGIEDNSRLGMSTKGVAYDAGFVLGFSKIAE